MGSITTKVSSEAGSPIMNIEMLGTLKRKPTHPGEMLREDFILIMVLQWRVWLMR